MAAALRHTEEGSTTSGLQSMEVIQAMPFILFIGMVCIELKVLDAIVTRLHFEHPDVWEAEGRPTGLFTHLPNGSFFARERCSVRWLVRPPAVTPPDECLGALFRRYRLLYLGMLVAWGAGLSVLFL